MGMAKPGIEPASGGATAQDQPPLRYQSPAHCDYETRLLESDTTDVYGRTATALGPNTSCSKHTSFRSESLIIEKFVYEHIQVNGKRIEYSVKNGNGNGFTDKMYDRQ